MAGQTPVLQILALGPPEVYLGERLVTFPNRKTLAVRTPSPMTCCAMGSIPKRGMPVVAIFIDGLWTFSNRLGNLRQCWPTMPWLSD